MQFPNSDRLNAILKSRLSELLLHRVDELFRIPLDGQVVFETV